MGSAICDCLVNDHPSRSSTRVSACAEVLASTVHPPLAQATRARVASIGSFTSSAMCTKTNLSLVFSTYLFFLTSEMLEVLHPFQPCMEAGQQ